ncbi:MAG TPA: NAD(P)/FAD-dependent oxidoreductase, partial [Chitinophagaceae bacterium]
MNTDKKDYDAIVVGSGPNGLAAAITLQQAGISVLLIEAKETIGGGLRSAPLTLPFFIHDVCSAVHSLAVNSPFLKTLPLEKHGLNFIYPPVAAAHPFDNGTAAVLYPSLKQTAQELGEDDKAYRQLMVPTVNNWSRIDQDILGPLHFPKHPFKTIGFGLKAFRSAAHLAKRFHSKEAKGLWAGMAAHSMLPFSKATSSAAALVLMAEAHVKGWPIVQGGSGVLADAMA